MTAINVSVFGDTIYVASGVYEEQVVMIPGLSLIGAGTDSCWIDSRQLVTIWNDVAVEVADSCLLKGFKIIVSNDLAIGMGVAGGGSKSSIVTMNKITNAFWGVFLDKTYYPIVNVTVYKNIIENVRTGVELFNSNSIVRSNIIRTDMNYSSGRGIKIGAFTNNYVPLIDSNCIKTNSIGLMIDIGTKPTIRNNVIFVNDDTAYGIWGGGPDSIWVYNNLILSENAFEGLANSIVPTYSFNNFLLGKFSYSGILASNYNVIKNNTVINSPNGITKPSGSNPVVKYNNSWNNEVNYGGFTPDSTNLSVDPMIVNEDTTKGELDFHLQMFSPLIDAGDPTILDKDGTRSDIGLYGGPLGESYAYLDLPPRPPRNLSVEVDTLIKLKWNKNTEADFNHYNLYRDTVANFTIDSTKLVASITDSFYLHLIPTNVESLYFKLTAIDNQGNESNPSEEVGVLITSVKDEWETINNYVLYQNYPNPFNPSTKIGYRLKERGYVKLYVYDIKGELVSVLVNEVQEAGYYEVEFNGEVRSQKSEIGGHSGEVRNLASGVYIYQIFVKGENNIPVFSDIKKMVFIK